LFNGEEYSIPRRHVHLLFSEASKPRNEAITDSSVTTYCATSLIEDLNLYHKIVMHYPKGDYFFCHKGVGQRQQLVEES